MFSEFIKSLKYSALPHTTAGLVQTISSRKDRGDFETEEGWGYFAGN